MSTKTEFLSPVKTVDVFYMGTVVPLFTPPPSLTALPLSSTVACHKLKVKTFQKLSLIITHKLIRIMFDILHTQTGRGKKTEAESQN